METKSLNFTSKLADFEVVNEQMIKCRCYMLATGNNANGSDITLSSVQKALARNDFYNKPIVAHLYEDKENGKLRVGGHDSKWVLSNQGIEMINECVPFGVIPESANLHLMEVLEPDGMTKNTYLVGDIVLWTGRYQIMDAAYSDDVYFNQSCEINVNDGFFRDDGVFQIDDFTFSALCLLNKSNDPEKNVRPCFPSCRVEKFENKFSLDDNIEFVNEFNKLAAETNKLLAHNTTKKEESKLDFQNVINAISSEKIADDVSRYTVVGCNETEITVFDKTDYGFYTVKYTVENTEDVEKIVFDFNNRKEMGVTVSDVSDDNFDVKSEFTSAIERATKDSVDYAVKKARADFDLEKIEAVKEITDKYEALIAEFNVLKTDKERADAKLAEYAKAEQMAKAEAHKNEIDAVIDRYADKLGTNPDYLIYKTTVDYSKEAKDVDLDMLVLLGKASMGAKATFSYQPQKAVWGANFSANNEVSDTTGRYGDLFDKVKNK